ncbi:hypothetical protein [Luteimonas salinilitoris]|uniref:Outer membrane protein assembly factor BamE n=1 Tax=Luteimonas salinilitoris TaxID=3237697 RepID=A0ABV4HMY6_9GAMM
MKKMFRISGISAAIVLLASCQGSPVGNMMRSERSMTLSDVMQGWVGKNEADLVADLGAPFSSYQNRDGSVVITWKEITKLYNRTTQLYDFAHCEKTFLIDPSGVVSKWKYKNCRSTVRGTVLASTPIPRPSL